MKITVTKEHIAASKGNVFLCPVDRAIAEALDITQVRTGCEMTHFNYNNRNYNLDLPEKVQKWIRKHDDSQGKVDPITFELEGI